MDISDIRICVLLIEGTNCEEESYLAFKRLGAEPDKVRLKEISIGKKRLADYHAVMIPGGFSAGDYIRAGAIFAARLRSALGRELTDFVDLGHPVLGICNGFQILIETGLLPGMEGTMSDMPEAVLATNDSGKFECRPTLLKHVNGGNCIFTRRLAKDICPCRGQADIPAGRGAEIPGYPNCKRPGRVQVCGPRWRLCRLSVESQRFHPQPCWHLQPERERARHDAAPGAGVPQAYPPRLDSIRGYHKRKWRWERHIRIHAGLRSQEVLVRNNNLFMQVSTTIFYHGQGEI